MAADEKSERKKKETIITRDRQATDHGDLHVQAACAPDKDGFRRAGIWFPRGQRTVVPADTLSQERYDLIMNEPMLVVVEGDRPKRPAKPSTTT